MKKLLQVVLFMTLGLFFTSTAFAQQSAVKVSNNNELAKALADPSVMSVEITQAGFYDEILLNVPEDGTIIFKGENNGNKSSDCTYWIDNSNVCFTGNPTENTANSGVTPVVPGSGLCPGENAGWWTVTEKPVGSSVTLISTGNMDEMLFSVTECGLYRLRNTWYETPGDDSTPEIGSVETFYYFYDAPVVDAGVNDSVCGLTATLDGDWTLSCDAGYTASPTWTKVAGPGIVTYSNEHVKNPTIEVESCGTFEFALTVVNGSCMATSTVFVDFFDTPEIVTNTVDPVPEKVCGFVSEPFYVSFYATCMSTNTTSIDWTPDAGAYIEAYINLPDTTASDSLWVATANECGTFNFIYTVENGPCSTSTIIPITFLGNPEPVIAGPTTVYTCSAEEYCIADFTCTSDDMTFTWVVSGGSFVDATSTAVTSTTVTSTCVEVFWDNNSGDYELSVTAYSAALPLCIGQDTIDILKQFPTLEGQVKYWNATETAMPTPFPTDFYGTFPEDYFYVTLYEYEDNGKAILYDSIATVKVEPRLKEDLTELMSYFDFELNTEESVGKCDAQYLLKVWDGGLSYHTGPNPPEVAGTYLGESYTYTNWGGVNATDALAVQLMVGGANELSGAPYNYTWVGPLGAPVCDYGYYSQSIADVNNTNLYNDLGITALDALTVKYRTVGLLGSFPDNNTGDIGDLSYYTPESNQFSGNFVVTGRMVDALPRITFPEAFEMDPVKSLNWRDIPFFADTNDYLYFSDAESHKFTSYMGMPWLPEDNYVNLYYEAKGDINASYVPTSAGNKAQPSMELIYEGIANTDVGSEMTIPISIDRDAEVGAITLSFNYRNDLIEVIGTNFSDDDVFINHEEGILNIAWYNTEGVKFNTDATIAQIRIRVLADISEETELFILGVNTELADVTATAFDDINLKTINISTVKGAFNGTELSASNYPNPFKNSTTISYMLPESGKVKVEVYNNMGVLVITLVDETQESGVQNVTFNTDVHPGVYFYNITVQGELNNYSSVKRMIVVH